jgi:hypothetical protein
MRLASELGASRGEQVGEGHVGARLELHQN